MKHLYVWDRARRKLRVVPRGGNGEGEGGDGGQGEGGSGNGDGGAPTGDDDDDGKTFSQEEVSRIAAREKSQGRQAAENELAEKLGVTVEEAAEIIEQHKQREDAEKTEAQRAREAAEKEKQEAEQAKAEAARERHEAKVERALLKSGVNTDVLTRATNALGNLEIGADDEAIKAEVDSLKKDIPSLFATNGKPPSSTPGGSPPAGGQPNQDAFDKGAERAKRLQGRTDKE